MIASLRVAQWIAVAVAAIVAGLFGGVVGLGVGAYYGGNYCNTCEFNGQRGYEAIGQIGFIGGAAMGLCLTAWGAYRLLRRWNHRTSSRLEL